MGFDFDQVKSLLKEAVRESFDAVKAENPTEKFYAFALYDADGDAVSPSANTEEHYQAIVARQSLDQSDDRFMYRWGTAEWKHERFGYRPFKPYFAVLESASRDDYLEFQVQSYGASVFALKELADEGYFGRGEDQLTVFFTLSDDENAAWLGLDSARRINPPELFAAFEPEWELCSRKTWGDTAPTAELPHAFQRAFGSP